MERARTHTQAKMAPPPPPVATLDEEEDPYHGIVSTRKRNPVVLVGEWRAEEGAPASCAPRRFSRSIGFGPRRAVAPCAPRCVVSGLGLGTRPTEAGSYG